MAAITPTPASCFKSAAGLIENVTLGATLTAGTFVYKDAADSNKVKAADNTTTAKSTVAGILLNGGAAGQPGTICTSDSAFVMDAVLTLGAVYVISSTAGKIIENSEVAAGKITYCGVATSTTVLQFVPLVTDVTRA